MSRQLTPLTRRILSIPHRAGLLAPGSKRSSSCLPIQFRMVACSLLHERMSRSPVTVARLRRICTGFPILPILIGHPMSTIVMLIDVVYALKAEDVKRISTRLTYSEASSCKRLISTAIPAIIRYTRSAACARRWLIYPSVSR
jgi:hypothetical protein